MTSTPRRSTGRIWRERGRYFVEDLGSTNGTRVRRAGRYLKVTVAEPLLPGDVVVVGRTHIPWGHGQP